MKIFNDMDMQLEEFQPIEPGKVKMYACGPTVYNYIHVGNARPIVIFDVLRRYLEYRGYEVTFVQNFTDVDDKIIKRANEEGVTSDQIAEKYIAEYWKDVTALGVRPATVHPKATENIGPIIKIIKTLVEKGYAYEVNGDVYYRTLKFAGYGKLSHQPIEDLQSGARIDVEVQVADAYGYDIQCQVVCEKGTVNLPDPYAVVKRANASCSFPILTDWKDRFIEAYDIELTHWVKTLEEKGEPDGPSAWDGYAACVAADALNRSRGTGRFLPVETMEKPELYR